MQIYHTTQKRAEAALAAAGFTFERSHGSDGVHRDAAGRRAIIDAATHQSFDRNGKHWFAVRVWAY